MKIFAAGHAEVCAAREASTVLLLGIQVLMAAAVKKDRVAAFDDKYLLDGMWIPDASGGSRWGGEEMALQRVSGRSPPCPRRTARALSPPHRLLYGGGLRTGLLANIASSAPTSVQCSASLLHPQGNASGGLKPWLQA
ncbi:hypothetical protein ACFT4A_21105, partial [Streptomyces sp. NPDC057099]